MNKVNKQLTNSVEQFLGPKLAAVVTGALVVFGQSSGFTGILDPGLLATLSEYVKDMGIIDLLPAPIAAMLAFYLRNTRSPGDEMEVVVREERIDPAPPVTGDEAKYNNCPTKKCNVVSYAGTSLCRDCGMRWEGDLLLNDVEEKPMSQSEKDVLSSIIMEKNTDVDFRIKGLEDEFKHMKGRFTSMNNTMRSQSNQVSTFIGTVRGLEDKIGGLSNRVEELISPEVTITQGMTKPDVITMGLDGEVKDASTSLPYDTAEGLSSIYGKPGVDLVSLRFPYEMFLSWDASAAVSRTMVHDAVYDDMLQFLRDIESHYGLRAIREFGLDQFGGIYNDRAMKGSSRPSTHSWAISIDLNPLQNKFLWEKDEALFAKPELRDLLQIGRANNLINAGPVIGKDFMHFQAAHYYRAGAKLNTDEKWEEFLGAKQIQIT